MPVADLHLDLAWNVVQGRDLTHSPNDQPDIGFGPASVSFETLAVGGTELIGATLFADPDASETASEQCRRQLDAYAGMPLRIARDASDFDGEGLRAVVLMEGADAIDVDDPDDARRWFDAGVRIVGLAWGQTRYAGGTRSPGPLTPDGRRLVPILDELGMIHDASHLADESLAEILDLANGPLFASHSNCRSL
ncbi:MAG: membrane dipeptidase, partial [Planctomycetota bacterium]